MTDFSYQLYSSRNFPPLADTLKMLDAPRLHLGRRLRRALRRRGQGRRTEGPPRRQRPDHADRALQPRHARERARPGARDRQGPGHRDDLLPVPAPRPAPDTGAGYVDFGRRLQEAGKPYRDAGPRLRLAQPRLRVREAARRRRSRRSRSSRAAPTSNGKPTSPGSSRAAPIRSTGSRPSASGITAVHVKDIAPAGENADEDGWADVGQGTVDWKAADGGAAARPRRKYFIMEHDNPKDAARFAERSLAAARSSEGTEHDGQARHRHHRLRQHLDRLLQARAAVQGLEVRACADMNMEAAEARGPGVRRQGADRGRPARQRRHRRGHQPDHPRRALRGLRAALEAGKHVYSEKPFVLTIEDGLQLKALADGKGLRVGCAPDTFLGGAHQLRPQADRRRRDRHRHRRHRPRDVATAWSTGTPTRTSSSCPAPARCSTSAPTTSPT